MSEMNARSSREKFWSSAERWLNLKVSLRLVTEDGGQEERYSCKVKSLDSGRSLVLLLEDGEECLLELSSAVFGWTEFPELLPDGTTTHVVSVFRIGLADGEEFSISEEQLRSKAWPEE